MVQTGWLHLKELYQLHCCTLVWKTVHKGAPDYLKNKLVVGDDWTIDTARPRLQITDRSFRWQSCRIWKHTTSTPKITDKSINFQETDESLASGKQRIETCTCTRLMLLLLQKQTTRQPDPAYGLV